MTDHAESRRALDAGGPAIGAPMRRVEDQRLLQGEGRFLGDLRQTQMLHAAVLRSQLAHARLHGVDASAARQMPGVVAVFTGAEVLALQADGLMPRIPMRQEPLPEIKPFEQPVIAHDKLRYVGEPLALVVAETLQQAQDALEAITVDCEVLSAVTSRAASASGDVLLHEEIGSNKVLTMRAVKGDAAAAFATAAYTRRERFSVHRQAGVTLETRGLLASWDAAQRRMQVEGASKVPFANRRILARMLGLDEASVEMLEVDVGGGFGVRGEFYPEDFLVPFASMQLGRPVKWLETRSEHFLATNHARDAECELEVACDEQGHILALRGEAITDVGAYLRTVGLTPSRNIAQVCSGPYRIQHIDVGVTVLLSNKTPTATYRAPGRFETDFFRERLFDLVAADLGIERSEFRRRNLVRENDMPWPLAVALPFGDGSECDSGDYSQTLTRCLEEFDWAHKSTLNGRCIDGRWHGIAVGCYIEGGASGPREGARLVLEADGRVAVYTGSSSVGQGMETAFTQIAADALQLPVSRIRGVFHGSTTLVKEGFGTYSSRATVMGGSAVVKAAALLTQSLRQAAATHFGCNAEEVRLVDGLYARSQAGDEGKAAPRSITLAELAQQAIAAGQPLSAEASFESRKRTYSYGAHAAHVAIDPDTGETAVLDYVAVEDVGRIINPLTLHGQTEGAVVQGLGGVFLEQVVYDDYGQPLTGSLTDYAMPRADHFPVLHAVCLELKPSPNNPLGAKGAGEGGVIPTGGVIANAISAALAPLGVSVRDLPLGAHALWRLIREARQENP